MKQNLRIWAKEERKKIDIETLSSELVRKLQSASEYRTAKNIMIFYPLKYEVNLLSLLEDKTKNFYLPKIDGKNLLCCSYSQGDVLCESCFKTKEPKTIPVDISVLDLVVVPALAVDKNNYRLGYGGGFYDRLFASSTDITKIVCLSKTFVVDSVYPEKHDIQMDKVIVV